MTFGFIVNALPIIATCTGVYAVKNMSPGAMKMTGCLSCLNCIGGLSWWITSCIFRFSAEGHAISGTNFL
jgi:hypothetical protein